MEAKNILLVGVWAFVLIWLVGMLMVRGDLLIALFLFLIAVAISFVAVSLPGTKSQAVQVG